MDIVAVPPSMRQRVIFLILPEVHLLDLAGPAQVFHTDVQLGAPYHVSFCGADTEAPTAQGVTIGRLAPLPDVGSGDTVMVPGMPLEKYARGERRLDPRALAGLAAAHAGGARIASICTGAFILGEAGLLNGRRCTTHWESIPYLRDRYPEAKVQEVALFTHDGQISTSAGLASGIDLALSLVEDAHGSIFAAQVARFLVIYLRRNGFHAQQSIYLEYRTHLHPGVHRAQDYLIASLTTPVTLEQLAEAAQMSVRSLSRAFKEATGLTPMQYHQRLRLEFASTLLEDPHLSIEAIAQTCGFDDARHFRRLWHRTFGSPPSHGRGKRE